MWGLIFFRVVSLVPILPDAVNQVVTMQFVLIAFLVSICLLLPWKVWHANVLDAFVTAGTIVALGVAAIGMPACLPPSPSCLCSWPCLLGSLLSSSR